MTYRKLQFFCYIFSNIHHISDSLLAHKLKKEKSIKYQHGPYYYLREEPEYKYAKYLGKKVPETIRGRIEIGVRIRELEKKHKKLHQSIKKLS